MKPYADLSIVIQAGGGSTRMGQNKALMPFHGQPLIVRVVERVHTLAGEVVITTNQPQAFEFLGLPMFPDQFTGLGALGGLHTALRAASLPYAAVVACDMPFVSPALIEAQRALLIESNADAVLPTVESQYEPFHAVYRVSTCLPAVERAIESGQRRAIAWMPDVNVRVMLSSEIRPYDPHLLAFQNVNTPEEFQRAEELSARLEG